MLTNEYNISGRIHKKLVIVVVLEVGIWMTGGHEWDNDLSLMHPFVLGMNWSIVPKYFFDYEIIIPTTEVILLGFRCVF